MENQVRETERGEKANKRGNRKQIDALTENKVTDNKQAKESKEHNKKNKTKKLLTNIKCSKKISRLHTFKQINTQKKIKKKKKFFQRINRRLSG